MYEVEDAGYRIWTEGRIQKMTRPECNHNVITPQVHEEVDVVSTEINAQEVAQPMNARHACQMASKSVSLATRSATDLVVVPASDI